MEVEEYFSDVSALITGSIIDKLNEYKEDNLNVPYFMGPVLTYAESRRNSTRQKFKVVEILSLDLKSDDDVKLN